MKLSFADELNNSRLRNSEQMMNSSLRTKAAVIVSKLVQSFPTITKRITDSGFILNV